MRGPGGAGGIGCFAGILIVFLVIMFSAKKKDTNTNTGGEQETWARASCLSRLQTAANNSYMTWDNTNSTQSAYLTFCVNSLLSDNKTAIEMVVNGSAYDYYVVNAPQ